MKTADKITYAALLLSLLFLGWALRPWCVLPPTAAQVEATDPHNVGEGTP